jgi:hypothetical protein
MGSTLHRQALLTRASLCGLLAALALQGSPAASGMLNAQVVQLPTVRSFGYSGAVSVPDQGTASLGGNLSSQSGRTTSGAGPLASRSSGSAAAAGSMSVSATVIDLQAMDAALLNQAAGGTANPPSSYAARPTGTPIMNTLTPHLYGQRVGRVDTRAPNPNAWEIALGASGTAQTGLASAAVRDESEIHYYMSRAQEAISSGRNAAARVYYRLAYEKLTPDQRTRLEEFQRKANEAAKANAEEMAKANAPLKAKEPAGAAKDF